MGKQNEHLKNHDCLKKNQLPIFSGSETTMYDNNRKMYGHHADLFPGFLCLKMKNLAALPLDSVSSFLF